ncbi:MAG: MBL fold metallo-hydrolase [Candidatus Heimdallarchaeota archaeon]|nr:MBL fold metallo-hydrolase [Candidatus Heimdallarchaeota archaeon]
MIEKKLNENLTLTGYGATEEVGRSAFILEDGEHRVLLEAGIKLRPNELSLSPEGLIEKAPELDAVLLSHAHVDHSGYLPALWENGYYGKLYMTEPTLDITFVLWKDHLKIEGRRHWSYEGLERAYENTQTVKYHERVEIAPEIFATFYNSGHILGASMILIDWKGTKILYTGDINDQQTPLFDGFEMPDEEIDVLITESTNGIREIIPRHEVNKEFLAAVIETLERGKKVIIPCFAVGRSQEVLCVLTENIKDYPIYVDGMINKMIAITEKYLDEGWVDGPLIERLKKEKVNSPFKYSNVFPITPEFYDSTGEFRTFLGKAKEPLIIVTTSGMMMPSPLHTHLRFAAQDKGNMIAITGYQAEGTIGREVLDGKRTIQVSGWNRKSTFDLKINAKVQRFGFSGHVSSQGLKDLISTIKPKKIIMIHGDPQNQADLKDKLTNGVLPVVAQRNIPIKLQ